MSPKRFQIRAHVHIAAIGLSAFAAAFAFASDEPPTTPTTTPTTPAITEPAASVPTTSKPALQLGPSAIPLPGAVPLAPEMDFFVVREGYKVSVAADAIDNARFMEFDDLGRLYVSRPGFGDIVTLTDADNDGYFESRATFVKGMNSIHGLSWHNGWMWFSLTDAIKKARDVAPNTSSPASPASGTPDGIADEIIDILGNDTLPGAGWHWWRSLLVTDEFFYTSIGDSGNATDETTTQRQKIFRFNHDGSNKTLFASGIRNTEKLRIRPGTSDIFGCDHGSDSFGRPLGEVDPTSQPITDVNPPDEFNLYTQDGFYGHPFLVGNRIPRLEFIQNPELVGIAGRTIVPAFSFPAHWAPNGFCFIEPKPAAKPGAIPSDQIGDAYVAFHGSWNSSKRVGYQVARVIFDNDKRLGGKPIGLTTIVSTKRTFPLPDNLDNVEILARPVDCVQAPDGSILFSCDITGRVYRIRYLGQPAK